MSAFRKATKQQAKARIALAGPAGSGKTYTALTLATHLADGKIAVVDTEHGSAEKYADLFQFDVLTMDAPYHPDRFVAAIKDAAEAGYSTLILDSLSHAWNGPGGLLEIVDEIGKRQKTANTFTPWKEATPIQNRMVEALLSAPIHIIGTMRSKHEYVVEQVERNGRTVSVPRKIGMAPIQRDAFEYEFDIFCEMNVDNDLIVTKTRCPALAGRVFGKPGKEVADIIRTWLGNGAPLLPKIEPKVEAKAEPGANGESRPAVNGRCTDAQKQKIEEMLRSHVITPAERDPVLAKLKAGSLSNKRAHDMIENLSKEIARREAGEEAELQEAMEAAERLEATG